MDTLLKNIEHSCFYSVHSIKGSSYQNISFTLYNLYNIYIIKYVQFCLEKYSDIVLLMPMREIYMSNLSMLHY